MRVASSRGSPTVSFSSRAVSAACAASSSEAGTSARRMAVHFWPAFTLISFATSLTKRSNSGLSGVASGPRIEALSESCSAMKRTLSRTITGWLLSFAAVAAEPVKETTSWPVRCSNRSPSEPVTSCSAPLGSTFDSTHDAHRRLGEIGGGGRGLDDGGNASEQRRRQLLQHAPDREVERIDVHRRALERGHDVLALERPSA
jgi:hypothetical protein